jgi:hypothetical protein
MAAISPPPNPLRNRFAVESYPNSRGFINWNPNRNSQALLVKVGSVLGEYIDLLPLSIRQIYYRLIAVHRYPKSDSAYNALIYLMGKARRAQYELVDPRLRRGRMLLFDAIRDDKFVYSQPYFYRNAGHFFNNTRGWARGIHLDRQKGQPRQRVIWCEAKGMIPMLEGLVHDYGIPVFSSGGVDSISAKYKTSMLWVHKRQPITILHIGDQDPMGLDLMLCLAEDLISFCGRDANIEFIRLAITPAQAVTGGENGRALTSDRPVAKRNADRGYNKMLMHLSTSGEYHTYELDEDRLVDIPYELEALAEIPNRTQTENDAYLEALNDFMDEIEVGDLAKVGKHLFAKIDSRATWQAEALDPRQFATIIGEAIEQRLNAAVFDAVILEEIKVQQEALDELPSADDPYIEPDLLIIPGIPQRPRPPLRRGN